MKTLKEIKEQVPQLVGEERKVLEILVKRGTGAAKAIPAISLAGRATGGDDRELRKVITQLIVYHRIPIVCKAGRGGGYFLPASEEEIEAMYRAFYNRGMTGLVKATRARKSAYVDSIVQMAFGFDEDPKIVEMREKMGELDEEGPPAWAAMTTQLLDRITEDPETYKRELEYIRERYGDIFVSREKLRQIRKTAGELLDLTKDIAA